MNDIKNFKHLVDRRDVYRSSARRALRFFFVSIFLFVLAMVVTGILVYLRISTGEDVYGITAGWVGGLGGLATLWGMAGFADNYQHWTFKRDEIDTRVRKYEL